jgi:hypothetical protein
MLYATETVKCLDVNTTFHNDWFRHSIVNRRGVQKQRTWRSQKPIFKGNQAENVLGRTTVSLKIVQKLSEVACSYEALQ